MSRGGQHLLVQDGRCISKSTAIEKVQKNIMVDGKPFLTKEVAKEIVEKESDFPKTLQEKLQKTTGIKVIKMSNPVKRQHFYDAEEVENWIKTKNNGGENVSNV